MPPPERLPNSSQPPTACMEKEKEVSQRQDDDRDRKQQQPLEQFVEWIPKVELHAHLNGCIRETTLSELAKDRNVTLSSHHFDLGDHSSFSQTTTTTSNNDDARHSKMYNLKPRSLLDCFDMFDEIPKCVSDLVALRRITNEALEDFAHHHVSYLELRSTPKCLLRQHHGSNSTDRTTKRDYVETILSVMQSFECQEQERYEKEIMSGKLSSSSCRLALVPRFLMSIDRSGTVEDARENALLAIELFQSGNPYVVGVDLGGNPTKNDFSDFEPVFHMVRDAGLKITLHCGEVPCGESADDKENPTLQKAYKEAAAILRFCPDRLGHALLLPKSLRPVLEQSSPLIPIECCPTSNVMTLELATHFDGNLVQGLKRHPQLGHWLDTNYPLSVSTDDSGVFNTDSSKELLLLAMAFNLDEADLERIVLQSIQHAFCDAATKSRLEQLFANQMKEIKS